MQKVCQVPVITESIYPLSQVITGTYAIRYHPKNNTCSEKIDLNFFTLGKVESVEKFYKCLNILQAKNGPKNGKKNLIFLIFFASCNYMISQVKRVFLSILSTICRKIWHFSMHFFLKFFSFLPLRDLILATSSIKILLQKGIKQMRFFKKALSLPLDLITLPARILITTTLEVVGVLVFALALPFKLFI